MKWKLVPKDFRVTTRFALFPTEVVSGNESYVIWLSRYYVTQIWTQAWDDVAYYANKLESERALVRLKSKKR